MNVMIYSRGYATDYDCWQELGNPGGSFSNVVADYEKLTLLANS